MYEGNEIKEQREMSYWKNQLYFYNGKMMLVFGIIGIVLAVLCFCNGAPKGGAFFFIIGALLGWLGWITPSDAEIDRQAGDALNKMDELAFKKLGIDEAEVAMATPVRFWGYRFVYPSYLGDQKNDRCPWKQGGDKKFRSSEVVITGFYFGENSVYCYERTLSLVSDAFKETTEEYFYRDIVSVKTETEDKPWIGPDGKENPRLRVRSEAFIIRNMGGESRTFNVQTAQIADEAVGAFRALLKQKKV